MISVKDLIKFLTIKEADFIMDVDTIQFFIDGLEREGPEYITNVLKEYEK